MHELPLRPYHEFAGALFRSEAEWDVPSGYRSLDEEVASVRHGAGLVDLSDRAKLELTGSERVTFLDGLVTIDVKILTPGTSAYALLLNEKSRVLADARVYAFRDSLILDMDAAQAPRVREILEKGRVSDDVEFRQLRSAGHIAVEGPNAAVVLAKVVRSEVRGLALDAFAGIPLANGREGRIVRSRSNGAPGFQVWAENGSLAEVWQALLRSGARPIGRDAYEVLRIEAGVPRYGPEMNEGTLALEVAPDSALSFTKGCYVGQEIVAHGTYVGQVRRKLAGILVDGDQPPVHGDRVLKADRQVGVVTSGTWSPTLGSAIALALLRIDEFATTEPLHIDRGGWDLRGRPHSLPFVGA